MIHRVLIYILIIVFSQLDFVFALEKVEYCVSQINQFCSSVDEFYKDIGRYPTSDEGLAALKSKPKYLAEWKGPYINKDIPLDAWGKEFIYNYPPKYSNLKYDIYSTGKNKIDEHGKGDDISNWSNFDTDYYFPKKKLLNAIIVLFSLLVIFLGFFAMLKHRNRKRSKMDIQKLNGP